MKKVLLAGIGFILSLQPHAQIGSATGTPYTATERARIIAERAQAQLRFEKAEETCYQRFAVNDCLRQLSIERRKTLEELRRQEIILNNIDRKLQAGERLQNLDEKKATPPRPAGSGNDKPGKNEPALTRAQELANEQAYQEKQLNARKRMEERDRQLEEKKKQPPVKSLPLPP
jgi:hypothetical protein